MRVREKTGLDFFITQRIFLFCDANNTHVCMHAQSLSSVRLFVTSWTVALLCGISQARILEWVVVSFSRRSSWLSDPDYLAYESLMILCRGRTSLVSRTPYFKHQIQKLENVVKMLLQTWIEYIATFLFNVLLNEGTSRMVKLVPKTFMQSSKKE